MQSSLLANTCTSKWKNENITIKEWLRQNNFPQNIEIYNSILWNIGKI